MSKLTNYIETQIEYLEKKYNFNNNNGYAQVQGKNIKTITAYGQYTELCFIANKDYL